MRGTPRKLVAAGTIAATLVLTPAMASATGTGQEFGQHVRECAQTTGFNGTHNPGMHHGFAGWNPAETC